MKTRFDGKLWIGAFGLALEVKDMETAHLLNTVKMLVQKPARVQAMLVTDIEEATFEEQEAWTPNGSGEDIRKKSLHNATSLTSEELVQYVTGTPLFKAMMDELEARGVNTENIMELYTKDAAFSAYGYVTSTSPLEITVDQKKILSEAQLILTDAVRDYTVEMTTMPEFHETEEISGGAGDAAFASHKHRYQGRKKWKVHNALQMGEKVILLRCDGGQQYIVLGRWEARS